MDVISNERSLDLLIASNNMLLAALSGLVHDCILDGVVLTDLASLELVQISRSVGNGNICDALCKSLEALGLGYEIGFATQAYECSNGLVGISPGQNGTFCGLSVRTLCSNDLTFFPKYFLSSVEVALSLDQGLLAVHHTGLRHLAELHYV